MSFLIFIGVFLYSLLLLLLLHVLEIRCYTTSSLESKQCAVNLVWLAKPP